MKPAPGLKGRAWTADDDDRLKSLIEASVSIDLIAAKMKRTTQGVRHRAGELRISTKRVWVRLKAKRWSGWTPEQDAQLLALLIRKWTGI